MRRKKASKRGTGRAGWILLAAGVGYLIGSWNASAVRSTAPAGLQTAAQTVALRFPQDLSDAAVVEVSADEHQAPVAAPLGDPQLALFAPAPIISRQQTSQAPVQMASADPAAVVASVPAPARKPVQPVMAVKPHAPPVAHAANRPGYMLDDTQIASIKQRLRLTPDQERMWPAVEVALRNIAFARARDAHQHGAQPGAIDPNSTEVQDLKSAAIPLLMSFNDQQKDEVRSLIHVMGVDQLATQF
ncbi:MAG: hypothetical protein WB760_22640 [Xanthobacteraceae bacterium]